RRCKRVLLSIVLAALMIGASVHKVTNNSEFMEGWKQAYYEGSMAGREDIFPAAVGMILERPVFGWGPILWAHELGQRTGVGGERDAHNLWLALLLEVGVVGAIPFSVGFWLCGLSTWRARLGTFGLLPLALLL